MALGYDKWGRILMQSARRFGSPAHPHEVEGRTEYTHYVEDAVASTDSSPKSHTWLVNLSTFQDKKWRFYLQVRFILFISAYSFNSKNHLNVLSIDLQ